MKVLSIAIRKVFPSLACLLLGLQPIQAQQAAYLNPSAPVDLRIKDLLQRMTLEEKIAQMCQYVGIEHQQESFRKNKGKAAAANDDASTFYKGISFDSLRNMVVAGRVGSFLHIVTAKEANEMQALAMRSRLKIPLIIGIDAIHGNALVSGCTVFPTPLSMASSWNRQLVKDISVATAKEMRATGSQWTFTPNIDIARDARWGRVGETFGEDTYLVSEMGVATVQGLQGATMTGENSVVSCIKHLIGGGESVNGLNAAPTDISERTLWELHLPPYKAAVDAGAFSAMAAHNELNGIPCHANGYLMNDIMRDQWGFKGFMVSDWMDIERLNTVHHVAANQKEAVYQTVMAGMDMHMHGPDFLEPLAELVREGRVPVEKIDAAVTRILEAKFRLGLFERPFVDEKRAQSVIFNPTHRELALTAARQSIILLKNDGVLPVAGKKKILVTGPNANNQSILGDWSLLQPDDNVTTILEGLRQQAPDGMQIDYMPSGTVKSIAPELIAAVGEKAKEADLCIVVVGENSLRYEQGEKTSGENIDRDEIGLIGQQNALVNQLLESGKPVIVVLVNSRPLAVTAAATKAAAVIEAWEPGSFGGQAMAEIIYGKVNPSGKLTISIPRSTGQIPTYYNYKPSNYFHKYILTKSAPLYEFGFGLSYTRFAYSELRAASSMRSGGVLELKVKVTNTGDRDGDEIVQLYIRDKVSSVTRPVKELKDFQRIHLAAGESRDVVFKLPSELFKFYNQQMQWILEPGAFDIMVGGSSRDADLLTHSVTID